MSVFASLTSSCFLVATPILGGETTPLARAAAELAPESVIQIVAKEVWTSAGKRVPDALLVVEDGKIRAVRSEKEADPSLPLVRHDGILTAGMVACRTQSGARGELQDDTRSVLPGARAAHAIDPLSSDFGRALAAGITVMGLSPGSGNLVGGLGCAVKTAGGRVLTPETSLALSLTGATLGRSTTRGGFLFGASDDDLGLARPDGGPESTSTSMRGTRAPTSYSGAVAKLEELIAHGGGPFGLVRKGQLAVTIDAWDRHEVLRALAFAEKHGLVGAIRGAPLASEPELIAALKRSGFGVIVGPYSADQTRPSLVSVARLAEAGIPVAFALDAPGHAPEELRLSGVRALQAGAPRDVVWKALTEDGARLAGVGAATGRLAPDLDADFVLWSGDPLDLTSHVVAVYVDGKRAWPPAADH